MVSTVHKKKYINDIKTQDNQSLSIFFIVVIASLTFLGIGCLSLIQKMYC